MSATEAPQAIRTKTDADPQPADVLVIFGITGDLAKVMTFHSLYRLEQRGLLDCPIVGVAFDDWTLEQLVQRARDSIVGTGEKLDEEVFTRFAKRLSYHHGDFTDDATYAEVAEAIEGAKTPVFYLEVPPSLFGTVVGGLAKAGVTANARVVVEKPFGHDQASARALADELHQYIDESQLLRIDHYLGKMGLEEILYLRFANTMLEPVWNRNYVESRPDHDGRGLRRRGPRPLLRPGRRAARRRRQPPHAGGRARRRWSRPPEETRRRSRTRRCRSTGPISPADPAHYVRGQYDGYLSIDGVAPDSTTETYTALRLDIDNWRWSGVPFFIRAGKRLPVTQTEVRLVFKHPPRLGFAAFDRRPEPNQLVIKLDPSTGVRIVLDARRADATGAAARSCSTSSSPRWAARARRRTRSCSTPRWSERRTRFTRQDGVEQTWRIMQPLLDAPPPVHVYAPGSWGPAEADELVAGSRPLARALDRVVSSAPKADGGTSPQSAAAPSPFTPIADYAFISDCHTGALVAPDGAIDWLCVPRFDSPSVFGSLLDRGAGDVRAVARSAINHPTAREYEPGTNVLETTWKTPSGLDPRPHGADDGPVGPRGRDHAAHAAAGGRRRGPHARAHGRVPRGRRSRSSSICEPVFDYGSEPATWTLVDGSRHVGRRDRSGTDDSPPDGSRARHRGRPRARTARPPGGRRAYCALSWAEGLAVSRGRRRGGAAPRGDGRASGAPGSAGRASPTIAGATRSSARRSRSRD